MVIYNVSNFVSFFITLNDAVENILCVYIFIILLLFL